MPHLMLHLMSTLMPNKGASVQMQRAEVHLSQHMTTVRAALSTT